MREVLFLEIDTTFATIKKLDRIGTNDLEIADEFIIKNLGSILHDDINHYEKLYKIKKEVAKEKLLIGEPFFIKIKDKYISQIRMSTGENLLISILIRLIWYVAEDFNQIHHHALYFWMKLSLHCMQQLCVD